MKILIHRCIIPNGNAAGNKHTVEILSSDIEYQTLCEVCGDVLVTDREVLASLYEFLTENKLG